MARHGLEVAGLALVVAAAMCALCSAQRTTTNPTAAAIMPTCAPVPISLSPCIGYVFGIGTATLSSCCSQLQAFFQSQGPCLCAMSRLAPSPFGLLLGQAQGMIPNVCNLPSNPCDDFDGASTSSAASTLPAAAGATSPAAPLDPTATTTAPEITPAAAPAAPATATTTTGAAPPVPAYDSPSAVAAPTPGQAGSSTGSHTAASKLPQLLHASGARSSRDEAVGTVLATLFLAYVSTMHV